MQSIFLFQTTEVGSSAAAAKKGEQVNENRSEISKAGEKLRSGETFDSRFKGSNDVITYGRMTCFVFVATLIKVREKDKEETREVLLLQLQPANLHFIVETKTLSSSSLCQHISRRIFLQLFHFIEKSQKRGLSGPQNLEPQNIGGISKNSQFANADKALCPSLA